MRKYEPNHPFLQSHPKNQPAPPDWIDWIDWLPIESHDFHVENSTFSIPCIKFQSHQNQEFDHFSMFTFQETRQKQAWHGKSSMLGAPSCEASCLAPVPCSKTPEEDMELKRMGKWSVMDHCLFKLWLLFAKGILLLWQWFDGDWMITYDYCVISYLIWISFMSLSWCSGIHGPGWSCNGWVVETKLVMDYYCDFMDLK